MENWVWQQNHARYTEINETEDAMSELVALRQSSVNLPVNSRGSASRFFGVACKAFVGNRGADI